MGFRGGGVKLTPPSVSWFSSTSARIGLNTSIIWFRFTKVFLTAVTNLNTLKKKIVKLIYEFQNWLKVRIKQTLEDTR